MAGSSRPRSDRKAACSSPTSCDTSASMTAETQPSPVCGRPATSPRPKLSTRVRPRSSSFSERLRQCRMGFCERKVKPRKERPSSSESVAARMGVSDSRAGLSRCKSACSFTSLSERFFLMAASKRSSRRSTTSRSARSSSVSRSAMSLRGCGAVPAASGKARTTCRSASAFRNSRASSPSRSPLLIPARSTTSKVARVVFFGLKSAVRRSTRSSGTRATPVCISPREAPKEDVATVEPVRRLKSEVLPLLDSPTRPIFMTAHATMAPPVPEHRPLDPKGAALSLLLAALWGANPVAIKLGLADMPPLRLALARFGLSAVVIFGYAMLTRQYDVNSYAVHTVVFAHFLIPADRLTPRKLAGVLIAYGGVIILFARSFSMSSSTLVGDLIVAVSALILGERVVYIARAVQHLDPVRLMLYQSLIGSGGFLL